jgi:5-(carboxyamino)imidazole ribonucleotide synthase
MPIWRAIRNAEELDDFISERGGEVIVKTPIGGYDGKGVRVVSASSQVADWLEATALSRFGGVLLAEEKVEFVREVAQLSARSVSGEFRAWPLVQTTQRAGVCAEVVAPAPGASEEMLARAAKIANELGAGLGVTGVFAVEMFETADGRLLINELAMRPHNSGHFSIEGSTTSQFEQHLRAVLDLPLGDTSPRAEVAVMVNLLGVDDQNDFLPHFGRALAEYPAAKVHTYGKRARAGRKMGHVTALADDLASARKIAEGCANLLLGN